MSLNEIIPTFQQEIFRILSKTYYMDTVLGDKNYFSFQNQSFMLTKNEVILTVIKFILIFIIYTSNNARNRKIKLIVERDIVIVVTQICSFLFKTKSSDLTQQEYSDTIVRLLNRTDKMTPLEFKNLSSSSEKSLFNVVSAVIDLLRFHELLKMDKKDKTNKYSYKIIKTTSKFWEIFQDRFPVLLNLPRLIPKSYPKEHNFNNTLRYHELKGGKSKIKHNEKYTNFINDVNSAPYI